MKLEVEIAVDSLGGCEAAATGGAHGVELGSALEVGGLTPSSGLVELACERSRLPVVVLVRPRAGDFVADRMEFETMALDVARAKQSGAAGVAIGLLRADGSIDREGTAELIDRARPMRVTFHRAFDFARDPYRALDALLELGVDRVLSSGAAADAASGLELLAELVERAGDSLRVVPAGGIRPQNVGALLRRTGAREIHASARALFRTAWNGPEVAVRLESSVLDTHAQRARTDVQVVRDLVGGCSAERSS